MRKLFLTFTLIFGATLIVACGKKKNEDNSCHGYPPGYVRVTDHRMLQLLHGGYGYNNGYNNGVVCVDQQTYAQLRQQLYGNNNGVNCQHYPSAPQCQGGNYGNGGNNGGDGNGHTDPYCMQYPYDPYCW
jgi:hypothetical protein